MSKQTIFKFPYGIGPSFDWAVDQTTIHPGSDLIQLHPGVVGMVSGSKVVAVSEEGDDTVGTAVGIKEGVALWNSHVLIFWDTSWPLGIKHLLNNLLTCR